MPPYAVVDEVSSYSFTVLGYLVAYCWTHREFLAEDFLALIAFPYACNLYVHVDSAYLL